MEVDLIASRLNIKFQDFCLSFLETRPSCFDGLCFSFGVEFQISLLFSTFQYDFCQVLQKVEIDQTELVIVVPIWPTATWFSKFLSLLIEKPRIFKNLPKCSPILWMWILLIPFLIVVVVPIWPTATWVSKLLSLLIEKPWIFKKSSKMLFHPLDVDLNHPLSDKMNLMGCRLSGKNWKVEEFSKEDTNIIIIGAKRGSTFKQYIIFFKKLRIFCEKQKEDPLCSKINLLLDFLTVLLNQGFQLSGC